MTSPEEIAVLTSVPTELEAAMVVAALKQDNIKAVAEGVLTSALRAEAPGEVRILVRRGDMNRAKAVLTEYQQTPRDVDWSDADVAEQEQ